MTHPIGHDVPDYPVQNLEVARRGLAAHQNCDRACEAKRYFVALVPHLEMITRRRAASASWNLWSSANPSQGDQESRSDPPLPGPSV
ncbi:hypothetical protein [Nocardia yunnanensis]|uniref:hypothetical protein n=1 Tax=Nocardia yunnanensis TaxID=2382165 RepID=UPI0013C3F4E1|nr:hypothetical protein [Nocardia yunnanensis]